MLRSTLVSLLLAATPPLLFAQNISGLLTLDDSDGANVIDVTLTVGSGIFSRTESDSTTASGTILLGGEASADTGEIFSLNFEGGDLAFTDMDFDFGFGQTARTRNVEGFPFTPNPPATASTEGEFDAALHALTFDQGTLSSSGLISQSSDLSEDPVTFTPLEQEMNFGQVTLSDPVVSLNATSYTGSLRLPVEGSSGIEDESGDEIGQVEVSGEITASGPVRIYRNAFTRWAVEGGIVDLDTAPSFTADFNNDGLPNGLAWALGLDSDETLDEPLFQVNADRSVTVTLPSSDLRSEVTIHAAHSPEGLASTVPARSVNRFDLVTQITIPATSDTRRFFLMQALEE